MWGVKRHFSTIKYSPRHGLQLHPVQFPLSWLCMSTCWRRSTGKPYSYSSTKAPILVMSSTWSPSDGFWENVIFNTYTPKSIRKNQPTSRLYYPSFDHRVEVKTYELWHFMVNKAISDFENIYVVSFLVLLFLGHGGPLRKLMVNLLHRLVDNVK